MQAAPSFERLDDESKCQVGTDGREVTTIIENDQDIYCLEHPVDWLHDLNLVPDVLPSSTASDSSM